MTSSVPRRTALTGLGGAAVGLPALATGACSVGGPDTPPSTPPTPARHEVVFREEPGTSVLPADVEASVAMAEALLERCSAVVVGPSAADTDRAVEVARGLRLPLLVAGPGLAEVLDRLATRTVVHVRAPAASPSPSPGFGDREVVEVVEVVDGTVPDVDGLPALVTPASVLVVEEPSSPTPDVTAPLLELVDAERRRLRHTDPRVDTDDASWLRRRRDAHVVGVGPLGEHFAQRVRTVRRAEQLPGGGWLPFPGRRMVALYGHPRTAALGMLGEQGPAASVDRAAELARTYARLTGDRVVPAFELIATVAAGSAGADGLYTIRTPVRVLEPWVEAARENGVYVVLDLQPGRSDFLEQAKAYERLLREPHVGLALDPEWRLGPTERPLERIGHVDVAEVNRVGRWLAALVRRHDLPAKVLTLHQFRTSMIRGREDLDTGLDEIQWLVHADGQGGQEAKQATWAAVRDGLPEGVFLGWKNFVDEDSPMLTPEETVARVSPVPYFVSYQ